MVSLGLLAFYVLLAVTFIGVRMSRRKPQTTPKRWHRWLALLMLTFAMVHSFAIGSETSSLAVLLFYIILVAAIVITVFFWRKRRVNQ